jgi:hypothetical protein
MILDKTTKTAPTIDEALALVDRKATSIEGWKVKGLGLRLVLLGLAEVQALRLSKLAGLVYEVEGRLIDDETIAELEPKQLFQLYQLSTKALTESSDFVERTLKNVQWNDIEAELLQAKASQLSEEDASISTSDAKDLLAMLSQLQAGGSDNTEE